MDDEAEVYNTNNDPGENSVTEIDYERIHQRKSVYLESSTARYARSTVQNSYMQQIPKKMGKSDRYMVDKDKPEVTLPIPLNDSNNIKSRFSRRLLSETKNDLIFEEDELDRLDNFDSKKTQEFSINKSINKEPTSPPLEMENQEISPHASYSKHSSSQKKLSFAMLLNKADASEENDGLTSSASLSKLTSRPGRHSVQPLTNQRKKRLSTRQVLSGKQDDSIMKLRVEKEKELERSHVDQEFIRQISREVKEEKAQRQRLSSVNESFQDKNAKTQYGRFSVTTRRDFQDDAQSTSKRSGENNTLILARPTIINLQRGSTINSTQQNGIFDASSLMPSPILRSQGVQKNQSTFKLLEAITGVAQGDNNDSDQYGQRASANFGVSQAGFQPVIPPLMGSTSGADLGLGQESPVETSQIRNLLASIKRKSMVEYVVKTEAKTFMLRDQDFQATAGVIASSWTKFDRLKSVLHDLFPDYSLDMHATIDVDSLIDIVTREFSKLRSLVTDLEARLGTVSSEKETHKKKLAELEIMMKMLLEKVEHTHQRKVGQAYQKTSQVFMTPQVGKSKQNSAKKYDFRGQLLYNNGHHYPTFGNVGEVDLGDSPESISHLQTYTDYAFNQLKNQSSDHKLAAAHSKTSEKRIMSVDFKERKNDSIHRMERSSHKQPSEQPENSHQAIYAVDTMETVETSPLENLSTDQFSVEPHTQITDLMGTELETHFTYHQDKGRYTLRKNSGSVSRICDCCSTAKCEDHKRFSSSKNRLGDERHVDLIKRDIKLNPKLSKKLKLDDKKPREPSYKKNILELTKEAAGRTTKHYFPKMDRAMYSLSAREQFKTSSNFLAKYEMIKESLKAPGSLRLSKNKYIALKTASSQQNLAN